MTSFFQPYKFPIKVNEKISETFLVNSDTLLNIIVALKNCVTWAFEIF